MFRNAIWFRGDANIVLRLGNFLMRRSPVHCLIKMESGVPDRDEFGWNKSAEQPAALSESGADFRMNTYFNSDSNESFPSPWTRLSIFETP